MATREENLKKINDELEMLTDEELDKVAGGSWWIEEEKGKAAGLELKNEDGSPGKWGYLWNTGDYYWKDNKLSDDQAYEMIRFVERENRQPYSMNEFKRWMSGDRDDWVRQLYNPR